MKDKGKTDWDKARRQHTANAEKTARKEVKSATGKDVKIAGKKVEHHHHAGVRESKKVGLNPKIAGERERMTAVHSRRDKRVHATAGDSAKPAKGKRTTHHSAASKIDKYEQSRAAKSMGVKGDSPKLPRGPKGRAGLVDSSATSKWRWPATADQVERAKMNWEKGEAGKAGAKADVGKGTGKADVSKQPADAPKPPSKADQPKTPKADLPKTLPKVKVPDVDVSRLGKALDSIGKQAGKLGRLMGPIGSIAGSGGEIVEIIARERPEALREGMKVELSKPMSDDLPIFKVPSGYTVEKTNGEVIYRGPDGNRVTRDKVLRETSWKPNYAGEA